MLYDLSSINSKLVELQSITPPPVDFVPIFADASPSSRTTARAKCSRIVAEGDQTIDALRLARDAIDHLLRKAQLWRAPAAQSLLPAMSLPVELLQTIFLLVVHDDPSPIPRFGLSHVCRQWRRSSLALKQLWSTVVITGHHDKEIFTLFAARSGRLSLSLVVDIGGETLSVAGSVILFQALDAEPPDHSTTLDLEGTESHPIRRIKKITLTHSETTSTNSRKTFNLDLLSSNLRELHIQSRGLRITHQPGSQLPPLTHLRLALVDMWDVDGMLDMLSTTPSLVYLELDRIGSYTGLVFSGQLNTLLHVHTLVLKLLPLSLIEQIATDFPTPSLENLHVVTKAHSIGKHSRVEAAFRTLIRSSPGIRTFELTCLPTMLESVLSALSPEVDRPSTFPALLLTEIRIKMAMSLDTVTTLMLERPKRAINSILVPRQLGIGSPATLQRLGLDSRLLSEVSGGLILHDSLSQIMVALPGGPNSFDEDEWYSDDSEEDLDPDVWEVSDDSEEEGESEDSDEDGDDV